MVEKGDSLLQGDYPHRFLSRKYSLKDSKNMATDPPFQSKEHGCNAVISQRQSVPAGFSPRIIKHYIPKQQISSHGSPPH
jgi:hypothetical protein